MDVDPYVTYKVLGAIYALNEFTETRLIRFLKRSPATGVDTDKSVTPSAISEALTHFTEKYVTVENNNYRVIDDKKEELREEVLRLWESLSIERQYSIDVRLLVALDILSKKYNESARPREELELARSCLRGFESLEVRYLYFKTIKNMLELREAQQTGRPEKIGIARYKVRKSLRELRKHGGKNNRIDRLDKETENLEDLFQRN